MTMALLMIAATISLLRKSSMRHLLFLAAYPMWPQLFPRQSSIERILRGNLQEYLLRAGITPLVTHASGYLADYLPVGFSSWQGAQGMPDGLYMVVDVGHAAIFLGKGDCWQHDIRLLSRAGKGDVLHNQEF